MKWVLLLLRTVFGLLFIYASLDKIGDPQTFAVVIGYYHLLPEIFIPATSIILPWIEIVAGAALVFGIFPRGSAVVLNALMAVFLIILIISAIRGIDVSCGCFSLDPEAKGNMALAAVRDVGLLALGLVVLWNEWRVHGARTSN